jgi:hypothetical protein
MIISDENFDLDFIDLKISELKRCTKLNFQNRKFNESLKISEHLI